MLTDIAADCVPVLAGGGDAELSVSKEVDDAAGEQDKKRKRMKEKASSNKKAKEQFKNVF